MNTTGKLIAFSFVTLLASCSGGNKWHLDGKISGLDKDDIVVLEGNNQGYWYTMDTLKVSSDGSYSYSREAQGYPDIYRLRVGEKSVYFPIDSIESVTLSAEAPDIDAHYILAGSPQAENLSELTACFLRWLQRADLLRSALTRNLNESLAR